MLRQHRWKIPSISLPDVKPFALHVSVDFINFLDMFYHVIFKTFCSHTHLSFSLWICLWMPPPQNTQTYEAQSVWINSREHKHTDCCLCKYSEDLHIEKQDDYLQKVKKKKFVPQPRFYKNHNGSMNTHTHIHQDGCLDGDCTATPVLGWNSINRYFKYLLLISPVRD